MSLAITNNVMNAPKVKPYAIELSKVKTTNAATLAPKAMGPTTHLQTKLS
jgi:hypothetical protein